jgi:hypothetical protein
MRRRSPATNKDAMGRAASTDDITPEQVRITADGSYVQVLAARGFGDRYPKDLSSGSRSPAWRTP